MGEIEGVGKTGDVSRPRLLFGTTHIRYGVGTHSGTVPSDLMTVLTTKGSYTIQPFPDSL